MSQSYSQTLSALGFSRKSPGGIYNNTPPRPEYAGRFFRDDFQTGQGMGLTAFDEKGEPWCVVGFVDLQNHGFREIDTKSRPQEVQYGFRGL